MLARLHQRISTRDGGWAMLMVIGFMFVASTIAGVALASATTQQTGSRRDQDYTAALAAAQAGTEDFVYHLNANSNYANNFGPTSPTPNTDPNNPALVVSGSSRWTTVPHATGFDAGQYQYTIVNTSSGNVQIRSNGRAGRPGHQVQRSLLTTVGRNSFLAYLYLTQYEVLDPYALQANPTYQCNTWAYSSPARSSSCLPIQFGSQDTINGPVHSLDAIRIQNRPTFKSTFSTGYNTSPYYVDAGSANPNFAGGPPFYANVSFPSFNGGLRADADPTQGGNGCVYVGQTRIKFRYLPGTSQGVMDVISPGTTAPSPGCSDTTAPMGLTTHTVPVPDGKVIWVDPGNSGCLNTTVSLAEGFPLATDTGYSQSTGRLRPSCSNGDVYVEGWLKGQVTIGATNNVIVTNNLRYVGLNGRAYGTSIPDTTDDTSGTDVLGLSAGNFVEVYHPLTCTTYASADSGGSCTSGSELVNNLVYPLTNVQIDAAVVASTDSFIVPNWNLGSPEGTLTVVGAIAQSFRGPVATSSGTTVVTGYAKNYNYDDRLKTAIQPPYLATLAAQRWNIQRFQELQANR